MEDNFGKVAAGRNAVVELIKSGRQIDALYVSSSDSSAGVRRIVYLAKESGAVIKRVSAEKLAELAGGVNHQGVVCTAAAAEYSTVKDILNAASSRSEQPFIIIADEIEDPHNLGAIIRTAEAAGAHGVIIPKRRSASLTAAVYKTSAGALSHMPVARVSNLSQAIDELKKNGVWIYAADMDGEDWCGADYTSGTALVIGSEGRGVSRLIKEKCDFTVSLKMCGKVNSLNASVAGGIIMYEICRQRNNIKAKNN